VSPQSVPELSVVIASYECRDLLIRCLDSLEVESAGDLPLDVLVVDNNSRDGTGGAVRAAHPWVRLIEIQENSGFSAANNRGLSNVQGRYVLLLNPDTIVSPGALRAAIKELAGRPEVGMLGVKLVQPDGRLDHACKRGFPTPVSALYHFLGLSRRWPTSPKFAHYTAGHVGDDEIALVDAVNGAFMLVRREALDDVGPLDEGYWLYMEDLDWCYRFWQAGWKVLYWPRVEVMHVKGGSSGQARTWRTNRAFHRGMWRFYSKFYRPQRSVVVTAAVYVAIHLKLGLSAGRSAARRRALPTTGS
jgi:GT2 family glycosyltransferase